jgi:excisionase family DNA binding protein
MTMFEEFPELMTPAEVRVVLRVSRTKMYAILAEGKLPVLRMGHDIRVRKSDLLTFTGLDNLSTGNASKPEVKSSRPKK